MNIELYINGQLCDLEKADLGIRLRRQLFNPKELSTKDSQKSYSITLPATPRNNEIFGHKNVEETVGKFTFYPDARLYVNNILIMEGKFRLSEISSEGYKGNLGVPAPLTAKDVFGERKMNDAGKWLIENFRGERSLTDYNTKPRADGGLRECIFPLALYFPFSDSNSPYITQETKFALVDFPPSVNCMQMIEKIFGNTGYTLSGTALDDERLQHLYVSHKNPEDFIMPFEAKKAQFSGKWTNWKEDETLSDETRAESQYAINRHKYLEKTGLQTENTYISCNLFRSDNLEIIGTPIDESHLLTISGGNQVAYTVPQSGLYKVDLLVDEIGFKMGRHNVVHKVGADSTYVKYASYHIGDGDYNRSFANVACELHLLRYTEDDFDLQTATMDNLFYRNNIDQKPTDPNLIFPMAGSVNFIDIEQNRNILCGFSWGRVTSNNERWSEADKYLIETYRNPLAGEGEWTHPMAIKHGKSYTNIGIPRESAVNSPGYIYLNDPDTPTDKYKVDLMNSAATSSVWIAKQTHVPSNSKGPEGYIKGDGRIQQVVYLTKGERLCLVHSQSRASDDSKEDWHLIDLDFTLAIEPFTDNAEWLRMTENGASKQGEMMNWEDRPTLLTDGIDLMQFLPTEVKIDEWISNFCKAFNLELIDVGNKGFALNVKEKNLTKNTSLVIDLDSKASVHQATNESLALPRIYKLGFTIDTAEEGYVASTEGKDMAEGETGGGTFETGSPEANQVEQTSNFSYCWYKKVNNQLTGNEVELPVITDHEVWDNSESSVQNKTYFNKAQRFWFHSGRCEEIMVHDTPAQMAIVSNAYKGTKPLWLNYKDKPDSILREYFALLTNEKEYTCVECHLTPEEYNMLDRAFVRFNGDLYNVVDADGFDPLGRSKTKLKLIKRL